MLRMVLPIGAAGLAAAALAVGGPITVHAAGSGGPCGGAGTGNPVQHTGNGHHSFTGSHNNCVNFAGPGDTAYLTDSDLNLINMNGSNDVVRNFINSSRNTVSFAAGANFDTLSASSASGNTVNFAGSGDTAYLTDSDLNLINMNGNNDLIHNFTNSSGNTISFAAGANSDTLNASNARGNTVTFDAGAVNDVVTLIGATGVSVTLSGGASNDVLIFTAGCAPGSDILIFGNNAGSAAAPMTIC